MSEEDTILYDRFRRRIEKISDSLYFTIGRRLEKSTLLSAQALAVLVVTTLTIFFISGGIVALNNPFSGSFARTTTSQSPGETTLYFILNGLTFLGILLMGRGATKKTLDMTLFSIGLVLFLIALLAITSIVCTVKFPATGSSCF
ncbi:MAG: hypothetical protein ACE5KH_02670 [Candidatus Geothermarchaeales archaeon]